MPTLPPTKRRGARTPQDVDPTILAMLERGALEAANHMEHIALDMGRLLRTQFPSLEHRSTDFRGHGLVTRMRIGGRILLEEMGLDDSVALIGHPSDVVRGWAAMAVGVASDLHLDRRLEEILPFAADHHFGVREWAWLSLRPHVALEPEHAILLLGHWSEAPSDNVRRFAVEVTRPRGVWSKHIPLLKAEPSIALGLLEGMRADSAGYVQISLGNWLNDASKSNPEWVTAVCERWLRESPVTATQRICRRGLRTLLQVA